MIVIILAIVKTKHAVSFLHNNEKNLKSKNSSMNVDEVKGENGTSYYRMEDHSYWQLYSKISKNLQDFKVIIFFKMFNGNIALC